MAPFTRDFLPFTLSAWVDDIAERMQCPPEFIAVTAVAALGAVLGRRIGVRPQKHTDWVEVCSFWGCVVGRPGWLKSPAMAEALKPLLRLEAEAQEKNEEPRRAYEQEMELWKLSKTARERAALGELKKNRNARPGHHRGEARGAAGKAVCHERQLLRGARPAARRQPHRHPGVPRRAGLAAEDARPRGVRRGARLLHDGMGRQERLHVRPHHPRPPAHQGGLRWPGRLYPASPHCRVSPARDVGERRQ